MFTLKIESSKGEIFELTHNTKNYAIIGVQGLTPPPITVNTSTVGNTDGTFYNSSRMEQRNIVIDIVLNGDIEKNRQQLYRIFNIKLPCTIYFSNKNRNVKIKGYVETIDGDLFSMREQIQISIICPRPYFEDLEILYTELSQIVRMFQFPFSITKPLPFSEFVTNPLCTIYNGGDVECGIVIKAKFNKTADNLTIYNKTTQTYIGFNYSFFPTDELTVNTQSGQMSVKLVSNGETINMLNYLKEGSSWIKLAAGNNDMIYSVDYNSVGNEYNGVEIIFQTAFLYGGV